MYTIMMIAVAWIQNLLSFCACVRVLEMIWKCSAPQSGRILFEIYKSKLVIAPYTADMMHFLWIFTCFLWRSAPTNQQHLYCWYYLYAFGWVYGVAGQNAFKTIFAQRTHTEIKNVCERALKRYFISFDQTKLNIRGKWNQNVICVTRHTAVVREKLKHQWN